MQTCHVISEKLFNFYHCQCHSKNPSKSAIMLLLPFKKVVICLYLFHPWISTHAKDKVPEPEDAWPYAEGPDELEAKLRNIRAELDKWSGLKLGESCETSSSLYVAYTKTNQGLRSVHSNHYDYDMFDPKKAAYANMSELEVGLKDAKATKVKKICPITKGMACVDKVCKCNDGSSPDYKFGPEPSPDLQAEIKVDPDDASGFCDFNASSYCNADWETKCASPYKCFIVKDEHQPEENLECTFMNLEKYNLDGGKWKCFCELPTNVRNQAVKKLLQDLKTLPAPRFLNYGEPCDLEDEKRFKELEKAAETSNLAEFKDFYPKLQTELSHASSKFLCSKKPEALLVCEGGKCACKYGGTHDPSSLKCNLKSGSECDRDGHPYPCPNGQKCQFQFSKVTLAKPVICTEQSLKTMSDFNEISRQCKCLPESSPSSSSIKGRFSAQDVETLKSQSFQEVSTLVQAEYDTWTFLNKGDGCDWSKDRAFFQLSDYIRAKLQHVYFKSKFFEEMQKTSIELKKVCDINKSMRCDFKDQKCACPTDGYLLEDIPSVYDEGKGKCMLKSGSLCHPTLTEWISCPDGEQCLYRVAGILCNRDNQKRIVQEKMRFSSAKCYCSKETVKPFDDAIIKKFKYKNKVEF